MYKRQIQSNSDYRIRSGILYVLMQAAAEGHTYLPEPVLLNRTGELLRVEITHIEKFIMDLCMDKKLIVKEKDGVRNVYAAQYYYLESVSYTHLDVYKRQAVPPLGMAAAEGLPGDAAGEEGEVISRPVWEIPPTAFFNWSFRRSSSALSSCGLG